MESEGRDRGFDEKNCGELSRIYDRRRLESLARIIRPKVEKPSPMRECQKNARMLWHARQVVDSPSLSSDGTPLKAGYAKNASGCALAYPEKSQ